MVDLATVEVVQDDIGWLVRVTNVGTRPQEYRCASKEQAQSLASVLSGSKAPTGVPKARPGAPTAAPAKPPVKK